MWFLNDGGYSYQYESLYEYYFDSNALNKKIRFHTNAEDSDRDGAIITSDLNLCGSKGRQVLGIPYENTTGKFIIGKNFIGKIYTIFSSGVSYTVGEAGNSNYTYIPSPNGKLRVIGTNANGTEVNELISPIGSGNITYGYESYEDVNEGQKEYDTLYVSGRYNFKIPKGDGTYYVIDTKNDCEADVITDRNFTSINSTIIASTSVGDEYEWELFFNGKYLYFDLSNKNNRRLEWFAVVNYNSPNIKNYDVLKKDTVYKIGGSNGNYLGTDMALYVNGSKKESSTTLSTYNNTSDTIKIGENEIGFFVGNIKIYEKTGLVYHIVPIMYNGNVAFYDKVNKRFMEITATPPSDYVRTRATGEQVVI